MGRTLDENVRHCFEKKLINGKEKWACKACHKDYALNVSRMRKHIVEDCVKTSAIIRSQLAGITANTQDLDPDDPAPLSPTPSMASTSSSTAVVPGGQAAPRRSASMERFVDTVGVHEKNVLDEKLARAMYHSGLPLNALETPYWKDFFNQLRPSYGTPSRYLLGGPLLENEHLRITEDNMQKIRKGKALGIMTDSYTNVRGESVIKIIITTPEPVVYKYVFRGPNRETGMYVGGELCIVIREIGAEKFWLLVTDNAANMKVAWTIVTGEFPLVQAVGCAAHCWQLLFKDIVCNVTVISRVYTQSKSIVKYVKKHSNVLAVFSEKQKDKYGGQAISLKLPSKTRWGGAVILMNSILKNKAALQETMIAEDLNVNINVRNCILNHAFWDRVNVVHSVLAPIHASITLIEGNNALLSDVFYLQKKFGECVRSQLEVLRLKSAQKKRVLDLLQERKEYTIAPIHLGAFLLDPRFCGEGLSFEEDVQATSFIAGQAERLGLKECDLIANLGEFRSRRGFFAMEPIWEAAPKMHPAVWWMGLCGSQPLSQLAVNLLSLPPTAAEVERGWSNYGHVHNKNRNRLLNSRASKLVSVRAGLVAAAPRKTKECKPLPLHILDKYLSGEGGLTGNSGTGDGAGDEEEDEEDEEEEDTSDNEWVWEEGDDESEDEEDELGLDQHEDEEEQHEEVNGGVAAAAQTAPADPVPAVPGPAAPPAQAGLGPAAAPPAQPGPAAPPAQPGPAAAPAAVAETQRVTRAVAAAAKAPVPAKRRRR